MQLFASLPAAGLLFFSPAANSLERHVRIDFPPVRFFRQFGVSCWLHLNGAGMVAGHALDRINVHAGPGGVLCVRRLPVPVIVTCHHTYWQQCRQIPSQFWKRIFIPLEGRTYRLASRIVAVSEATRDALVAGYRIPAGKITVIHNAVDPLRFFPLGVEKDPDSLLYLGRVDRRKGIDFLIRSMAEVKKRRPGVRLLVGGKGPYLEKMKSLVRALGLEGNVTFLGFVPEERLNELYNRAQCVVVPSIFEGFGITVIEALAAGTRVVGTDTDGIAEILRSGDYGRLVPYGDRRALAHAICAELGSPHAPSPLPPKYLADSFASRYREVLEGEPVSAP